MVARYPSWYAHEIEVMGKASCLVGAVTWVECSLDGVCEGFGRCICRSIFARESRILNRVYSCPKRIRNLQKPATARKGLRLGHRIPIPVTPWRDLR
jgi:hypothetical protein